MTVVKRILKRALTAVAPEMTTAVLSARARSHSHRLVREWGLLDLNQKLLNHFGATVQSGPFRSMILSPMTHQESLGPFLLGTYEQELHPWIETLSAQRFTQIIDVGAKFGFYAVGFARLMPDTPMIAFDTDSWAREATREMILQNSTPNATTAKFCSSRWLDRHLLPESFIFTDCEGFEGELFCTTTTRALDSATVLIEVHDNLVPGVGAALTKRFAATHHLEAVSSVDARDVELDLGFLTPDEVKSATSEARDPQDWYLFTPKVR